MGTTAERLNDLLTLCSDDLDEKISAHMGLDLSDPIHEALLLRIRCDKAIEEVGEAHAEIIAYEGSNPRKKRGGSRDDIGNELLDEAFTGLLAFYHVTGRSPIDALAEHVARKAEAYYGIVLDSCPTCGGTGIAGHYEHVDQSTGEHLGNQDIPCPDCGDIPVLSTREDGEK